MQLCELIRHSTVRRAGKGQFPILSMTMHHGLIDQGDKFKKRIASLDTSHYRIVSANQLVVGFPIDEGVLSFQRLYKEAIVSPAYDIWDITDPSIIFAPYLERFLRSPQALSFYASKLRGTTARRRSLPDDLFLALSVPIPTMDEQRRIAEVLDRAEGLRAKRRATLAHLDALTQSIFLDMFGDPVSNPRGWVTATLGDVATFVGGGTPSRAVPEYFSGSLCWATSKDMKGRFLDDTEEHVTELAVQNSATKLVPPGTILVVVKSKVLMHRLPVAVARVQTCFGQDLKGITLDDRCTVSYASTALRIGQGWLLDRARGINTEGLSLDHLRRFPLLLPPLSLQKEFERRAEQVEVLRQSLGRSLSQLETLFASLQHRAFRGEL